MKKLFFLLLPLLAAGWLVFYTSCDIIDDEGYKPKPPAGLVLEHGTEKPISGARVSLQEYEGELLGAHSFTEIDYQFTNEDGAYDFDRPGFLVTATKESYFTDDQTGKPVLGGSERNTDIHLYAHAWLKVTLKNQSGAYGITVPGETVLHTGKLLTISANESEEIVLFREGNVDKRYMFSVIPIEGQLASQDLSSLTVEKSNGDKIALTLDNCVNPCFGLNLPGHDTTSITITY